MTMKKLNKHLSLIFKLKKKIKATVSLFPKSLESFQQKPKKYYVGLSLVLLTASSTFKKIKKLDLLLFILKNQHLMTRFQLTLNQMKNFLEILKKINRFQSSWIFPRDKVKVIFLINMMCGIWDLMMGINFRNKNSF